MQGILKKKRTYYLKEEQVFKPLDQKTLWTEKRIQAKQHVRTYLQECFKEKTVSSFFTALVAGEIDDPSLFRSFSETGLAHLLAISGFHFSLLVCFLQATLRRFLSYKVLALALLISLSFYLLFLGSSPSVLRAWIGACFFYVGHLIEKRAHPLNTLGIALCVVTLVDPFYVLHLGFQLSFLATAGLLLFTTPIDDQLQKWLPKRPLHAVADRSLFFQHLYVLRSLFRKTLAISLAAQIAVTPLLLSVFHSFSWHHILYNLFVPTLVGLLLWAFLVLLLVALVCPPLKTVLMVPFGTLIAKVLAFIDTHPFSSSTLTVETFPAPLVAISLTLLFSFALLRKKSDDENSFFYLSN